MVSIWKTGERINIYFDERSIVIYPEEKQGLDQLFGKIFIIPIPNAELSTLFGFMTKYKCVSQQENNAILVSPHRFNDFLEGVKVLSDLGYDGEFKLTQKDYNKGLRKYLLIQGVHEERNEAISNYVEIETIFDPKRFPVEIIPKEITFDIDQIVNEYFFHKFLDRFSLIKDESVELTFIKSITEEVQIENNDNADIKIKKSDFDNFFTVELKSNAIQSSIEGKKIKFKKSESENLGDQYHISLTKLIFSKLFSVLKHQGISKIGINNEESVDVFFTLDKAKSVSIYIEATSCNF